MRIVLIGQAPFGARTLEALLAAGEEVVAVYTPWEKPGAKPDPLKETALAKGIRNIEPRTFKDDQVFSEFAGFADAQIELHLAEGNRAAAQSWLEMWQMEFTCRL